jgi:hypothetical protein
VNRTASAVALWMPRLRAAAIVVGVALHAFVPLAFGMYAGLLVFSLASVSIYPLFWDTARASNAREYGSTAAALIRR